MGQALPPPLFFLGGGGFVVHSFLACVPNIFFLLSSIGAGVHGILQVNTLVKLNKVSPEALPEF